LRGVEKHFMDRKKIFPDDPYMPGNIMNQFCDQFMFQQQKSMNNICWAVAFKDIQLSLVFHHDYLI
jgi:hypothetical protein